MQAPPGRRSEDEAFDQQLRILEVLFDRVPVGIAVLDRDLVLRRCNPTWAAFVSRYSSRPLENVVPGTHFLDLVPGSEETSLTRYRRALAGETVREEGVTMRSGDKVSYWDVTLSPLVRNGEVIGVVDVTVSATERVLAQQEAREQRQNLERAVAQRTAALSAANDRLRSEIEERARAEEALRTSEEKYRDLVENANSIILRLDTEGRITFFNEFAQRFFGYSAEEIVGRHVVGTIVAPTDQAGRDLARLIADIGVHPERYAANENENLRRDGSRVWVAWTNRAILDKHGKTREILCVGNDITERRAAAEALRKAHEDLEARVAERTAQLRQANEVLQTEIAERQRMEAALRERVSFENLVMSISTDFLNLSPSQLDEGISRALKAIGEFAGVDRSYVFMYTEDQRFASNTHEWCAPGIAPEIHNLQNIEVHVATPRWTEMQLAGEVIHIPEVAALPEEWALERANLESQGIRSLITVPLVYGGKTIGFLGFDSVRESKTWSEESVRLLRIVGEIFVSAIERTRAEQELKQAYQTLEQRVEDRTRELYTLMSVQQAISTRLNPDDMLQLIADEALRLTSSQLGVVFLAEGEDTLRIAVVSGAVDRSLLGATISVHGSLSGLAVRTGKPQISADTQSDPRPDAQMVQRVGARNMLVVPLVYGERAIGGIALANKATGSFGPEDERQLVMLAAGAAIDLENARLYREEQERRQEAEQRRLVAEGLRDILAILNSNRPLQEVLDYIVAQACRLMGTDAGALFRLEPGGRQLSIQAARGLPSDYVAEMTIPTGRGAVGRAVARRQPVAIDDLSAALVEDPEVFAGQRRHHIVQLVARYQAILAVPLVVKDEVYGGIVLYYPTKRSFSDEEVALAATFGDQAALAIENARLRAQAEQAAVAAERSRLARDLHDAVTQTLFSASLIAEVLPRLWDRNPEEGKRRLEELRQLTRGALAEMRTLLLELRPTALTEAPFPDLLRQLAEALTGRARVPATVEVRGDRDLTPDVQIAFYRIAQEALNNVAKHSGATAARIRLEYSQDGVGLSIEDDGRGFEPEGVGPEHLGLDIMRERAEAIGASVEVVSAPGRGTRVVAKWRDGGHTGRE